MNKIWAIILAAGESKRMKVPKMLLPFNEKTMIEKVIENVTGSEVFNTLVVLGSYRDEILGFIRDLPVIHCYNENYREGMLSSVKCGFKNLPDRYKAVLVFPGDQPLIEPAVINKIIAAYRRSGKGIVIPVYKKKRGHPLLVDFRYSSSVEALDQSEGLNSLAENNPQDVFEVSINSPGIIKDFDTKEDYLNEINRIQ
ncbi:MAG: nucleotidyltransferase family protein [Bacteroidales bacterium]